MKIIADTNIPFVKEAFTEFGVVITVPGDEITNELCRDATLLLVRSVTRVDEALLEGTAVKFVATATTGTDHIDTAYLAEHTIGFASAPGSNANSVAEYVISALLHLEHRGICSVKGSTLGIIGVGNVGSRVYKMAQALGIECLLNDPPKRRLTDSDLYGPLHEVLARSDIVSVHVPLTMDGPEKTYHMVNDEFLSRMRDGAVFINTSRGSVVDEKAVCERAEKKLHGIVIDVWENEPVITMELLNATDIATPHIAGYSFDGKLNGIKMIHDAACAFFYKDKKWDVEKINETFDKHTLNLSATTNPLYDAVSKAYNIASDDENLRTITSRQREEWGSYFKKIRRTYRKRLEFAHFHIQPDTVKDNDKKILEELGFIVT